MEVKFMKRKGLKLTIAALAIVLVGGAFVGCSKDSNNQDTSSGVSGSITLSGSTALQPLIEKSAEVFKSKNPDASISVQGGGSGTGLTQVLSGAVDIGNSDIFAEEKLKAEDAKQLEDHKVVAQGFAVVTSKDVTVKGLTKQQIKDIFSGKVTNWKEVGGADQAITVIHRPASSGTRATFVKTVLDGNKALEDDTKGIIQDANGSVKTALESNKGAISYLALSYLMDEKVKESLNILEIDNLAPTKENITSGKYPFWSWGHMYTKGEAKDLSKAFIDFITSEENKATVEKLGLFSGGDMKVK
jgi:phosphate transport system substrate-binding protein